MLTTLIAVLIGNVLSAALAGVVLFLKKDDLRAIMPYLISFATGTLLTTGFAGILPEAAEALPVKTVMLILLGGILAFMLLEKTLIWRHCHAQHCEVHPASGYLIIAGDTLHNFFDGMAIAVSFGVSSALGVMTTIAIFAHEIPQELGDLAVLLHGGFSKKRAFYWNIVSSCVALAGAAAGYFALEAVAGIGPYALSLSAASIIYVSMSDLIPSMSSKIQTGPRHFIALLAGAGLMLLFLSHGHA
ncbi:MAG: ZIP family metal transporter [Elusimicrobiaceae bacterium]|nr:ZIP family metal transporter [Elusimicrobiaceae bacterium]